MVTPSATTPMVGSKPAAESPTTGVRSATYEVWVTT
jgi:hypothetical protein